MLDWTPLAQAVIGLAAAAVPVLAAQVWRWLAEKMTASAVGRLGEAAKRAAGTVAVELLQNPTAAVAAERVREEAIRTATAALAATMSGTVAKLGGTEEQLAAMIRGELGRLLAARGRA